MQRRPKDVNICGIVYTIEYKDKPSEVDIFKRDSLWGQIDPWTRTIRVYDNKKPDIDVLQTIIHEMIHSIAISMHLKSMKDDANHNDLDVLATTLVDTFVRNGWIEIEG
jgi:hypothetical protein